MDKLRLDSVAGDGVIVFRLYGAIDHHSVRNVRIAIDTDISRSRAKEVVLDLSGVEFMDSSGLGLILGRYTKITDLGGHLTLRGLTDEAMKIVTLAGVDKFIPCEKARKGGFTA